MVDLLAGGRVEPDAPALIDAATDRTWSYGELDEAVATIAASLEAAKSVVFLLVRRDIPSLLAYLGALRAGHAVLPMEADSDPSFLRPLVATYDPEFIVAPPDGEAGLASDAYTTGTLEGTPLRLHRRDGGGPPVHQALTLLLSTSGSTGSPKLVRLSAENLLANGHAIREALQIGPAERAVTSLAFSYSFGLSVVHSHLLAGASLVVSGRSIMLREFWDDVRRHGATSFSGVPHSYELIRRVGFEDMDLPSLQTLAQAGGKLGRDGIRYFHELMSTRGGVFIPMYGQTEATARISVLPPEYLPEKLGSVGFPLPGGSVGIRSHDGAGTVGPGETGELVYKGPNVMMGYANTRQDLTRGDELNGVLFTGDSGYVDSDGCLFITGRLKRFTKIRGLRINLDEVEGRLQQAGPVAALDGGDDRMILCCLPESEATARKALLELATRMKVHARHFTIRTLEAFPQLPNGKIDYGAIEARLEEAE